MYFTVFLNEDDDDELLHEKKFQYVGWQHIVNSTFVFHWYQYDLLSQKFEAK